MARRSAFQLNNEDEFDDIESYESTKNKKANQFNSLDISPLSKVIDSKPTSIMADLIIGDSPQEKLIKSNSKMNELKIPSLSVPGFII
mmetsp:Transcript_33674/g.52015  ORF Transcript_33674/g.52015 Transcript_33674/m.52015 type:complete len:88 (-) Transcript_33674:3898-4161(-)